MSRLARVAPRPPSLGRWPLPALGAWIVAWLVHAGLTVLAPAPPGLAPAAAMLVAAGAAAGCQGLVRRVIVLAGFPLSLALVGAGPVPAGVWLLPAAVLLVLYPVRAWRDAPLYPTGARALAGLAGRLPLPPAPRILDAGCGLGHGLAALAGQWPHAALTGLEHSRLLAWLAARRCPGASILRGDMWRHDWGGYDLVYLFQRPESMSRAWDKALHEMRPGSWLVSLEFAVDGAAPQLRWQQPGERPVLAYRMPAAARRDGASQP